MAERKAQSRYAGLRLTFTTSPAGDVGWFTASVKNSAGGWDEWTALAPPRRVDASGVRDIHSALLTLLGEAQSLVPPPLDE